MTVSPDPDSTPKAQLISSCGPEMKPSRLIIVCQISLPTLDLLSHNSGFSSLTPQLQKVPTTCLAAPELCTSDVQGGVQEC